MRKPFLITAAAGRRRRRAGHGRDRHDRHRQQRPHDRHAEALAAVREGAPGHQAQMGHARGERAAPARDHRHRHQGRPVRRHDHRHVRGADLGQEGLARADRRPAAPTTTSTTCCRRARRPVLRRQALRRCRSTPRARCCCTARTCSTRPASDARAADLGSRSRSWAAQAARPGKRRVRHLPARQAGLGRQHGVRHHDGEHLRRPVVRQRLEAAARHPSPGRTRSTSMSTC